MWADAFLTCIDESLRGVEDVGSCKTGATGCMWCGGCDGDGASCQSQGQTQVSQVGLYRLVSFFSVQAACRAMFGRHLMDINDKVAELMLEFDEHVWMILVRYPSFIGTPAMEQSHTELMAMMRQFVSLAEEERSGASWAITSVLEGMEIIGMDMESRAAMVLMMV